MTALACPWPVLAPEKLWGGLAAKIEASETAKGKYPSEWPAVAWLVKTMNDWRCERCSHPHAAIPWTLTVHHLDGVKANLQSWNLAALCQRCHLAVQARVVFFRPWYFEHSPWMARHVAEYNEWAAWNGEPPLPLLGIGPAQDYLTYWPKPSPTELRGKSGSPVQVNSLGSLSADTEDRFDIPRREPDSPVSSHGNEASS